MKFFCYCTESYQVLVDQWLVPSFQDFGGITVWESERVGPPVNYKEAGWYHIVAEKAECILRAIRENRGELIVFLDPDMQFFAPLEIILRGLMGQFDLLVARDSPQGVMCSGFMVMRASIKTERLWTNIRDDIGKGRRDDQDCLNRLLRGRIIPGSLSSRGFNRYLIRWGYLPPAFFSGGMLTGRLWSPGETLEVPEVIVMHHANYTVGLNQKIAQLEYVRRLVDQRSRR